MAPTRRDIEIALQALQAELSSPEFAAAVEATASVVLPDEGETSNAQRGERGERVLARYMREHDQGVEMLTALSDLLADFRHYLDQADLDGQDTGEAWLQALDVCDMHYLDEVREEGEQHA